MRKFTYITQLFAVMLLLVQLSGCKSDLPDPEPIPDKYARPEQAVTAGIPVLNGDGTSIYSPTGGNFRMSASMIANADGTLSAWYSTPGGTSGSLPGRTSLNSGDGGGGAQGLGGSGTPAGAIYYPFDKAFYGWAVSCPGWGKPGHLHFALYAWSGTYNATLEGEPIAEYDFSPYADNAWLELNADNTGYAEATGNVKFPAGSYLLFMQRLDVANNEPGFWGGGRGDIMRVWFKGSEYTGDNRGFNTAVQYTAPAEVGYAYQIKYFESTSSEVHTTWSEEPKTATITPSKSDADRYYAKDPSVVKAGDYYYLAYTASNTVSETKDNNIFVARSKSKTSTKWEKWNGIGWGGDTTVAPLIDTLPERDKYYGAAEPSMVVKDGQIYLYYAYQTTEEGVANIYLKTADPSNENWPAALTDKGVAIDRSALAGHSMDGANVVYAEEQGAFLAMHDVNYDAVNSYIVVWKSADGLTGWTMDGTLVANTRIRARHATIVADDQGHVKANTPRLTFYQFGTSKNSLKTWLQSYTFAN
ncbi:MAG: hypothetical protein PHV49_01215 [Alistipes sp.]|nr:hypothetical protein [Alistipes sp.]